MLSKMFLLLSLVHTPDGDVMKKFQGPFEDQASCEVAQRAEANFLKQHNIPFKDAMLLCIGTPWSMPGQEI